MSRFSSHSARDQGVSLSLRRRALVLLSLGAALTLTGWSTSSDAGEGELLVIVHPSNSISHLERSELRPIFQTTKKNWPSGGRIEPLNLPEGSTQREQFDRAVLGFSPDETVRFWIDRKVRGDARPPRKLSSPSAVLSLVAQNPAAIGYVPSGISTNGVRIVARVIGTQVRAP
jgi:ABC-type phosphate transport system substrate-binding protein